MPHVYTLPTPGAPTFTDDSASPSSFGLDHFAAPIEPVLMDREWYDGQDYYPQSTLHAHSRLSSADDMLSSVAFSYPTRTESGSEPLTGMSKSSLFPPLFPVQCHVGYFEAHLVSIQAAVRDPAASASCNPGFAFCDRVILLVDSQSHVTGAVWMPQLDTSHDGVARPPRNLQTCTGCELPR
jgi:hypothetical protein